MTSSRVISTLVATLIAEQEALKDLLPSADPIFERFNDFLDTVRSHPVYQDDQLEGIPVKVKLSHTLRTTPRGRLAVIHAHLSWALKHLHRKKQLDDKLGKAFQVFQRELQRHKDFCGDISGIPKWLWPYVSVLQGRLQSTNKNRLSILIPSFRNIRLAFCRVPNSNWPRKNAADSTNKINWPAFGLLALLGVIVCPTYLQIAKPGFQYIDACFYLINQENYNVIGQNEGYIVLKRSSRIRKESELSLPTPSTRDLKQLELLPKPSYYGSVMQFNPWNNDIWIYKGGKQWELLRDKDSNELSHIEILATKFGRRKLKEARANLRKHVDEYGVVAYHRSPRSQ